MEAAVTTGAIRHAKIQSNHHHQCPAFYRPDALPVAQPSVKTLKGKVSHCWHSKLPWPCLWPLTLGYFGCQASHWPSDASTPISAYYFIDVILRCEHFVVVCSLSKITKCQSTLRTSWKKKVEERTRNKSIKNFERNLKEEKKRKLEVSCHSVFCCKILISAIKSYVQYTPFGTNNVGLKMGCLLSMWTIYQHTNNQSAASLNLYFRNNK